MSKYEFIEAICFKILIFLPAIEKKGSKNDLNDPQYKNFGYQRLLLNKSSSNRDIWYTGVAATSIENFLGFLRIYDSTTCYGCLPDKASNDHKVLGCL